MAVEGQLGLGDMRHVGGTPQTTPLKLPAVQVGALRSPHALLTAFVLRLFFWVVFIVVVFVDVVDAVVVVVDYTVLGL